MTIKGNAKVSGSARVAGEAEVYGSAWVYGSAEVSGSARVAGEAEVYGSARVYGSAWVYGSAEVSGEAWVSGEGRVGSNDDIAWVDRVGTGNSLTLHRTVDGWRINAGCRSWDAPTVAEVCDRVRQNMAGDVPEWVDGSAEDQARWRRQIDAALVFVAASVREEA